MGEQKSVEWYDEYFTEHEPAMIRCYNRTSYYQLWKHVIEILKPKKEMRIIEIGCGSGQFARMLFHNNIIHYNGYDFSSKVIALAKEHNQVGDFKYFVQDIFEAPKYWDGDVCIALEVLEHLDNDQNVFDLIHPGTFFIGTVPSFGCPSHVRWFNDAEQINNRYKKYFKTLEIIKHGRYFIFYGMRDGN